MEEETWMSNHASVLEKGISNHGGKESWKRDYEGCMRCCSSCVTVSKSFTVRGMGPSTRFHALPPPSRGSGRRIGFIKYYKSQTVYESEIGVLLEESFEKPFGFQSERNPNVSARIRKFAFRLRSPEKSRSDSNPNESERIRKCAFRLRGAQFSIPTPIRNCISASIDFIQVPKLPFSCSSTPFSADPKVFRYTPEA